MLPSRKKTHWKLTGEICLRHLSIFFLFQVCEKPQRNISSALCRLHGWNCFRVVCQTQPAHSLPLWYKASQGDFLGTLYHIPVPPSGAREMDWGSGSQPHSDPQTLQTLWDITLRWLWITCICCHFILCSWVNYHASDAFLSSHQQREASTRENQSLLFDMHTSVPSENMGKDVH